VYVNIGDPLVWANTVARRLRVRALLGRISAVAALTESSRGVLVDHFGMSADAVHVIRNGRYAADFPPTDDVRRRTARATLGLPLQDDIVAYVGALSPEKRPDVAIDAVARVGRPACLLLVGDGPLRAEMQRRATAALGGRAVFLGTRSDVPQILAAADVLVLPSDTEGLPGVLIEAGLVGLPVVATDVGFVRDVVVDDVTGILVPPGDVPAIATALERALNEGTALGDAARQHCLDRFEMERVVDAWEALLHDVRVDR
jgi:glycosyltransferase involved in cell wall biosynthesis